MKRTALLRCPPAADYASVQVKRAKPKLKKEPKPRARMKRSRPTMTPIRKSARDQSCTICLPGICNRDPETTVLCHSNYLADGKGMGLKAPDTAAAYGCSACHDVLDGRRPRPRGMTAEAVEAAFRSAVKRTHVLLRAGGML